jgi:ribose/xylose/arabinose/galactoside ABC-type transport system permease subunit
MMSSGMGLPVGVVLALIVFFAFGSEAFLTLRNLTAVSGQASTLLLACLGATFVILMGSIDLSVGAIVLLVGAVTVKAINAFDLGIGAVFVGLFTGMVLGGANGLIFAYGRIPSFVVTLGTLSVFTGAAWEILEGRALRYDSIPFEDLAIGQLIPRFPNIALIAVVVWGLMVLLCFATRFGRYMYIIGGGEAVATTAGIPVRRYKIYAFMLSGAMAGLAGSLAVARLGTAGPTLGQDLLLNTLAAIVRRRRHVTIGRDRRRSPDFDRRADHRVARQRTEPDGREPVLTDDGERSGRHCRCADKSGPWQGDGREIIGPHPGHWVLSV